MPAENALRPARDQIPNDENLIPAGGDGMPRVGGEGERVDLTLMRLAFEQWLLRREVPRTQPAVPADAHRLVGQAREPSPPWPGHSSPQPTSGSKLGCQARGGRREATWRTGYTVATATGHDVVGMAHWRASLGWRRLRSVVVPIASGAEGYVGLPRSAKRDRARRSVAGRTAALIDNRRRTRIPVVLGGRQVEYQRPTVLAELAPRATGIVLDEHAPGDRVGRRLDGIAVEVDGHRELATGVKALLPRRGQPRRWLPERRRRRDAHARQRWRALPDARELARVGRLGYRVARLRRDLVNRGSKVFVASERARDSHSAPPAAGPRLLTSSSSACSRRSVSCSLER